MKNLPRPLTLSGVSFPNDLERRCEYIYGPRLPEHQSRPLVAEVRGPYSAEYARLFRASPRLADVAFDVWQILGGLSELDHVRGVSEEDAQKLCRLYYKARDALAWLH